MGTPKENLIAFTKEFDAESQNIQRKLSIDEPVRSHLDYDDKLDSYVIMSAKQAVSTNEDLAPGAAMHLIRVMLDERSNRQQALLALIEAAENMLAINPYDVESAGMYKQLGSAYADAKAVFVSNVQEEKS